MRWKSETGQAVSAHLRPRHLLFIFLGLHVTALAVVALWVQPTLPLDVIEQLGWSRDLEWVYFKHPPLPAAILAALMAVSGFNLNLAALAAPLSSALAMGLVYGLARRMLDPWRALIAAALLEGVIYYNYTALQFNHDNVQLPIWVGLAWCGHVVWRDNRGYFWLGLLAGVGILAKYAVVMMFLALGLAFLLTQNGRERLRNWRGLALAAMGFLLLLIPHLYGLWRINFTPFEFPLQRSQFAAHWYNHFIYPAQFLASQGLAVLGMVLLSALFWLKQRGAASSNQKAGDIAPVAIRPADKIYVTLVAFAPFGLCLLTEMGVGVKFRDMWGTPMFSLGGLWVMMMTAHRPIPVSRLRAFALWVVALMGLAMAAEIATIRLSPAIRGQGDHMHYPHAKVVTTMRQRWDQIVPGQKLDVVVADFWTGGLFATYDRDHPSVMLEGQAQKSPWITKERIARHGALVIWSGGDPASNPYQDLTDWFGAEGLQRYWRAESPLVLPYETTANVPPVELNWAILLPMTAGAP
ncbi:MAG: glycosyltransferase family 39 protein [Candidatus Symbiobacter sp.]|nr:glycosyltransferase family 39 protein [Candidatus Symbiobacter sp.]